MESPLDPDLTRSLDLGHRTGPVAPDASASVNPPNPLHPNWPRLAGYEITAILGAGGMGTVYRARQLATNREVALKLLSAAALGSPRARSRFEREVELAAALEHPNIARVYDSGLRQGICFYAMELIEGQSVDAFLKSSMPAKTAEQRENVLRLFESVCRAVHAAHIRGVIHRDLKPSNVLVTADGQPHVLDFGLAKSMLGDETDLTVSHDGGVSGTPAYMSPEQACGEAHLDMRTDVYSLGVMLFRLLTANTPHDLTGSYVTVMRRISEADPRRPRTFNARLDAELEAVILKTLARERNMRYSTAGELADDIARYRRGEPVFAKSHGLTYLLFHKARKHRGKLFVAAGFGLLFIAGGMILHRYVRQLASVHEASALEEEIKDRLAPDKLTLVKVHDAAQRVHRIRALVPDPNEPLRRRVDGDLLSAAQLALGLPALNSETQSAAKDLIALIGETEPAEVPALEKQLADRSRRWEPLVTIEPPFAFIADQLGAGTPTLVESGAVVPVGSPPKNQLFLSAISGKVVEGAARVEAVFGPDWDKSPEFGVLLKAGEGEYQFVVQAASDSRTSDSLMAGSNGKSLEMSIYRNVGDTGKHLVLLQRQTMPLAHGLPSTVTIHASREGGELSMQAGDAPALTFNDIFPLDTVGGDQAGVLFSRAAPLQRLVILGHAWAAQSSPLERGDRLLARDAYAEALEFYRQQEALAGKSEWGQEARAKQAVCLLALHRQGEARPILERLAAEDGNRWPVFAAGQLWLVFLREGNLADADAIAAQVSLKVPFDQVTRIINAAQRAEVWKKYSDSAHEKVVFGTPAEAIENCERFARVGPLIGPDAARDSLRLLTHAYWRAGRLDDALRTSAKLLDEAQDAMGESLYVADHAWLLAESGHADLADALLTKTIPGSGPASVGQALLQLERCRILWRQERWSELDKQLTRCTDMYGSLVLADRRDAARYGDYACAWALRALLCERNGDAAGALAAWNKATWEGWMPPGGPLLDSSGRLTRLFGAGMVMRMLAAARAGTLTDAQASKFFREGMALLPASALTQVAPSLNIPPAVLRNMWLNDRARDISAHWITHQIDYDNFRKAPLELIMWELVREQGLPAGAPKAAEDESWDAIVEIMNRVSDGRITHTQLLQLGLATKGVTGTFGWSGVADELPKKIRAPIAFFLGQRALQAKKPETVFFLKAALKDLPQASPLRPLAEAALQQAQAAESDDLSRKSVRPLPTPAPAH